VFVDSPLCWVAADDTGKPILCICEFGMTSHGNLKYFFEKRYYLSDCSVSSSLRKNWKVSRCHVPLSYVVFYCSILHTWATTLFEKPCSTVLNVKGSHFSLLLRWCKLLDSINTCRKCSPLMKRRINISSQNITNMALSFLYVMCTQKNKGK
jgi:hypothetical protein